MGKQQIRVPKLPPSIKQMEVDSRTGLTMPESYFIEKRLAWYAALKDALTGIGVKWKETDERTLIVRSDKGQFIELDTQVTQAIPIPTMVGLVKQWAIGKMTPDSLYRILTPGQQIELSNRVRMKPNSKDGGNVQAWLDIELKKREDLRRQGFDPKQEGLL